MTHLEQKKELRQSPGVYRGVARTTEPSKIERSAKTVRMLHLRCPINPSYFWTRHWHKCKKISKKITISSKNVNIVHTLFVSKFIVLIQSSPYNSLKISCNHTLSETLRPYGTNVFKVCLQYCSLFNGLVGSVLSIKIIEASFTNCPWFSSVKWS